jgi:hypothetical protein
MKNVAVATRMNAAWQMTGNPQLDKESIEIIYGFFPGLTGEL